MNFLQNFTAKLDKAQLEVLIRESVESSHPDMAVKKITFNCTTAYDQFDSGPGSPVFSSVDIVLERKTVQHPPRHR